MELRARSRLAPLLLAVSAGAVVAGCSPSGTAAKPLREAMLAGFCPEAGELRTALTAFPPASATPTPSDWRALRRPAIAMLDAAEALPKAVADFPGYPTQVTAVRTAGRTLVEAVDRRDAAAAIGAGATLLRACSGCHAAGGAAPALAAGATARAPAPP